MNAKMTKEAFAEYARLMTRAEILSEKAATTPYGPELIKLHVENRDIGCQLAIIRQEYGIEPGREEMERIARELRG